VCDAHRRAAPVSKLTVKSYSMVGIMDEMNLRKSSIDKSARMCVHACVSQSVCVCVCLRVCTRVRASVLIVCAVRCVCVDPIQDQQNRHVCRPPHTSINSPPTPPLPHPPPHTTGQRTRHGMEAHGH
jgi:hypothetical protein